MLFENDEENKLVYTDIFKSYQETVESFIANRLAEEIEGFSMEKFLGDVA